MSLERALPAFTGILEAVSCTAVDLGGPEDASCRERSALVCATAVRSKAFQDPLCLDGPTSLERESQEISVSGGAPQGQCAFQGKLFTSSIRFGF